MTHSLLSSGRTWFAVLALGAGTCSGRADAAIALGDVPLLFADDAGVAARGGLVRTVHAARTRSEPVLKADQSWEGSRVYVYGSAYRDEATGEYRLWYMSRPGNEVGGRWDGEGMKQDLAPSLRNRGFDVTLYATSRDGVVWTKPALNLHAYAGSAANNIVFDFHSPSVLRDEFEKDPAKRYKMLGYLVRPTHSYQAAFSADGIHWQAYPKSKILEFGDTITLSQDARTGEYLAYHKRPAEVRGFPRRVVWLSRSTDLQNWSEPEMVFTADEIDDTWTAKPDERTEVYDMSVFPHAAGFIGLPAIFRVMKVISKESAGPGQSPHDGPIDIQLATSRDGRTWQRTWPRVNVIPRGAPGTFDGGAILGTASVPVDTDDETWVYYTAINTGHGGAMPPKTITVGRAEWRRHGFVSLDAGPGGGTLATVPLQLRAAQLVVNADASRGELRVALCEADGSPIPGFGFDDCAPLQGNATRWAVKWSGGAAPVDRPVIVKLAMTSVQFYSLQAVGAR